MKKVRAIFNTVHYQHNLCIQKCGARCSSVMDFHCLYLLGWERSLKSILLATGELVWLARLLQSVAHSFAHLANKLYAKQVCVP